LKTAFLIPGDLSLPTGGYRYDREVLARLPDHGIAASHVALPGSFPSPADADVEATLALMHQLPGDTLAMLDGLALGAMPPAAIASLPRRPVALVHHPLGLESGLSPERSRALIVNETAVLAHVAHVIVTSRDTAAILERDLAVPPTRVTVAEPGTDRASRAAGSGGQTVHILAVGAVSPRKAFDLLVMALSDLAHLEWRLTIAGDATRDPAGRSALEAALRASDIAERVTLAGAVSTATLDGLYAASDLFVSSSLYEGYGMALAEALARGLPMVASTGGAAAATVPDAAALKVPPGDRAALAAALARAISDAALRRRMADAAWAAAALLPDWDDTARVIADTLRQVAADSPRRR
jgi:glycosyltransferase involved in cell wall biosynthesis